MSIITKKIKEQKCYRCVNGLISSWKANIKTGQLEQKYIKCDVCNGTGVYTEYYSCFIDDEKGIAFGGEYGQ